MRPGIKIEVSEHIKHVVLTDDCWMHPKFFDAHKPELSDKGKDVITQYLNRIGAKVLSSSMEDDGYWTDIYILKDGTSSIRFISEQEYKLDPFFHRKGME